MKDVKILQFPHPILLKPCEIVLRFDKSLQNTLDFMWKVMKESRGVGLAANQLGIPYDMFVLDGPNGRINMVNPYISSSSSAPANLQEGCLSAPNTFITVPGRAKWVLVKYQDEDGKSQMTLLEGIHAVAVQHEIDHLEGLSFLQHPSLPRATRKKLEKTWKLR